MIELADLPGGGAANKQGVNMLVRSVHRVGGCCFDDGERHRVREDRVVDGDRPGNDLHVDAGFLTDLANCGFGESLAWLDVASCSLGCFQLSVILTMRGASWGAGGTGRWISTTSR